MNLSVLCFEQRHSRAQLLRLQKYSDRYRGCMMKRWRNGAEFCILQSGRTKPFIDSTRAASFRFAIGTTVSSEVGNIIYPVGNMWMSFDLHVVNFNTPILLSLDDMDRLGVYMKNLDDFFVHRASGEEAKITRLNGHPYLRWEKNIASYFTFFELKCLHRRFGRLHVDKPVSVLNRAEIPTITTDTRRMM